MEGQVSKGFMRMLIGDDATVQDVKLALAKEQHDRNAVFNQLVASGDVSVLMDMNPEIVRVRVDTEIFSDARKSFPSSQLMARVQLALHAGLSDKTASQKERMDNHMLDAMRFGMHIHKGATKAWANDLTTTFNRDSHIADFIHDDAQITHKVVVDKIDPRDFFFLEEACDLPGGWNPEPEVTATVKPPRTKTRKGLRP